MIQATTFGRISTTQTPAFHSALITALSAAALFLPPSYVVAAPALLLLGAHLVRTSTSSTSRRLGWLAIFNGAFVIAVVAFVLLVASSGALPGGR